MEKNNELTTNTGKKSRLHVVVWALITITLALTAYFVTSHYLEKWPIQGSSMTPTIQNNDWVLVFKTDNVDYDDIIIFYSDELQEDLIKRVIGKENDVISCVYDAENNCFHLYRNGELLDESHIRAPMNYTGGWQEFEEVVPEGKIYVLGDNRNHSLDSQDHYYATKEKIVGKAFIRIWVDENNKRKLEFIKK